MEVKLKKIETWYRQSGLLVNESKTCLCLFYYKDTTPIEITLKYVKIRSTTKINVLGVIFDQKLQWADRISHCISKSSKALSAIKIIKRYFNTTELLQLVTSNFYSILYYNSEIWHIPSLKCTLKQKIMSSSAKAIKMCMKWCTNDVSFIRIHEMNQRATLEKYLMYKHALSLHKLMNNDNYTTEWVALNFNQTLTSRQTNFFTLKNNRKRVGMNAFAKRVFILNGKIPLTWFEMSFDTFKVNCKAKFLIY